MAPFLSSRFSALSTEASPAALRKPWTAPSGAPAGAATTAEEPVAIIGAALAAMAPATLAPRGTQEDAGVLG